MHSKIALRAACAAMLVVVVGCTEKLDDAPAAKPQQTATPKPRTPDTAIVLRIGEREVNAAEFARLLGPPPMRRSREPEPQRKRAFLDELTRTELLAIEARKLGVFDQPAVVEAEKELLAGRLLEDLFGEQGSEITPVTDDDVRTYYEAHIDDYSAQERVRARHILLRDRAKALTLLKRLQEDPKNYELFGMIAAAESLDMSTRPRAGDLAYFERKADEPGHVDALASASMRAVSIPDEVRAAAFALQSPGDLAPSPIKSADGFHVVQLTAKRPATRFALAQVARVIREKLVAERQQAAIEAFVSRLSTETKLKIDESKLSLVRPKLD